MASPTGALMSEPDHENLPRPRRSFRVLPIPLALVICAGAVYFWGFRHSDDKHSKPTYASVPDEICSGLVLPDDLDEFRHLRQHGKIADDLSGALPGSVTCTVGSEMPNADNLYIRVQPLSDKPDEWPMDGDFWKNGYWKAPLGAGAVGMASSVSGWVIIPCSGVGHGDLLARADIASRGRDYPYPAKLAPQLQHPLAALLVHTANTVSERANCGTAPIPEPEMIPAPYPDERILTAKQPDCAAAAAIDGPVHTDTLVKATPKLPAPLAVCVFGAKGSPSFVTFHGPMTTYAPPSGRVIAQGKVLVARTVGVCGSEPTVWTTWIDPVFIATGVVAAHDRLVDDAVKRKGCTVEQRFVLPEATAPAASTPVTPTPSRT